MLSAIVIALIAVPSRELDFLTEANSHSTSLSYGFTSGGVFCAPKESLTVTAFDGAEVSPSVSIEFECSHPGKLLEESGAWPVTKLTDSRGQARVIVYGAGTSTEAAITVTAKWKSASGNVLATANVSVELGSYSSNSQVPPELPPLFSTPCSISYAETLTWFVGYSSSARSDWSASGRVGFIPGTSLVDVLFDDSVCDSMTSALAFTENTGGQKHIHYNRFNLDGDPTRAGSCPPNNYARLSWRHANLTVANHELGHALGLGHTQNLESIVYPNTSNYFCLGVEKYAIADQFRLNQLYAPCSEIKK